MSRLSGRVQVDIVRNRTQSLRICNCRIRADYRLSQTKLLEQANRKPGDIEFVSSHSVLCRFGHSMMVIVPAFSASQNSNPPHIATVFTGVESAITVILHVAESVDELRAPENRDRRQKICQGYHPAKGNQHDHTSKNVDNQTLHGLISGVS